MYKDFGQIFAHLQFMCAILSAHIQFLKEIEICLKSSERL